MRALFFALTAVSILTTSPLQAQCLGRGYCDPSAVEIRSQITVNVPIPSQSSTSATLNAIEDARKQLYGLAGRECETLREIFKGECSLTSVNMSSSVQDRGVGSAAFVSISNVYTVKKDAK